MQKKDHNQNSVQFPWWYYNASVQNSILGHKGQNVMKENA